MRFNALDGWRGVCALAVALFHLNVYGHLYDISFVRNSYLFVDFFFVLSGFVISSAYSTRLNTSNDVMTFLIRRLGRLWPLHISVLFLFIALEFFKYLISKLGFSINNVPFSNNYSVVSIFTNVFLVQSLGIHDHLTWNFPSWSISSEYYTYLLFAILCLIFHKSLMAEIIVFLFIFIFSLLVVMLFSHIGQDTTYHLGFFRCASGFFCGVIAFRYRDLIYFHSSKVGTLIEILTIFFVIEFVSFVGRSAYSFAAPFVFALAVIVYSKEKGFLSAIMCSQAFQRLGKISYSIYMIHAFIIINFINRPIGFLEKFTGAKMTSLLPAGATSILGPDVNKVISLGDVYYCDLLTLLYLIFLLFLANKTYEYIEIPAKKYFYDLSKLRS